VYYNIFSNLSLVWNFTVAKRCTSKGGDLSGVSLLYVLLIIRLRCCFYCEVVLQKYMANMYYIYLGIIAISMFINIITLALVDIDSLISLISTSSSSSSSLEIGNDKIILKIDEGKVNSDLVQTQLETDTKSSASNNKLESVDGNKEDKCKGKNLNPLKDIHKRLLFADKSHFPSHFQKNCLPKVSEDVPVYGNKLVFFKPSSLLQDRNLPGMSIELPKTTSMGKLTELHKAIDGADEAVKLYDSQFIKFNKVLSGIKNGTEEFYPNEAKPLMETYVDLVAKLSDQQKVMANEAINQLHKLDSKFSRDLYFVENSGGVVGTGRVPETVTGTGSGSAGSGARF
jgi:hypothetical protein